MLLLTYMVVLGATYNGVLNPQIRLWTIFTLGLGAALWLFARRRKTGARWHRTVLDAAILLWVAAFAISLLANLDSWRRIVMGLWYMGAYIGMVYVLHDALANRLIRRAMLMDALLFAGLIVMLFGYIQTQSWMRDMLPQILAGETPLVLPRPVSVLGNSNTLAAALVMLLPLSLGRALTGTQRLQRLVMSLYSLAAALLLFLTFSRGGWLAAVAAVGLLILWRLAETDRLSPARWREWWLRQWRGLRLGLMAAAGIGLAAVLVGAILFARTFTIGGRTLDLRTYIYDSALTMIAEKPLTGHGLFTFGAGLARLNSSPPRQPHSHAHNLPLHVAAELGVVGVAALLLTVWLVYRAVRANLLATAQEDNPTGAKRASERLTVIFATTAFVGFCAHHLPDLPAMNPAIMVLALVTLTAAVAPVTPQALAPTRSRIITAAAVGGGVMLLASGLWSSLVYQQYIDAVSYGINSGDYTGAAAQLQPVVAADPQMAVYHQQRGFLLGLAAAEGNTAVLPEAIAEYERYTQIAPEYSIGWANLGALYAQAGNFMKAVEAMGQAATRAPNAPSYADRLAEYETAAVTGQLAITPVSPPISLERDATYMPDINYIQWLRLSIERQFLPQVRYGT